MAFFLGGVREPWRCFAASRTGGILAERLGGDVRRQDACTEAARDADLLILEGMGPSVETNRSARFTCDVLRAAVIKDPFVANYVGVELFSPIWVFQTGESRVRPL